MPISEKDIQIILFCYFLVVQSMNSLKKNSITKDKENQLQSILISLVQDTGHNILTCHEKNFFAVPRGVRRAGIEQTASEWTGVLKNNNNNTTLLLK